RPVCNATASMRDSVPHEKLTTLQEMDCGAVGFGLQQQGISGLLGKSLEVAHRMQIRGNYLEYLTCFQLCQGFLGTQNGKRTLQAGSIDFQVGNRIICAHIHQARRSRTQASTDDKAGARAETSVPPPMAISGRPPPLPPT